jgi:hypothetical protein
MSGTGWIAEVVRTHLRKSDIPCGSRQRDVCATAFLLRQLHRLVDAGNTVVSGSSTTSMRSPPPTGSSIWAPAGETRAVVWSPPARRPRSRESKGALPRRTSLGDETAPDPAFRRAPRIGWAILTTG